MMVASFEVDVFGHHIFLNHTLPFVLRVMSPEIFVRLAYVEVLTFSVITPTARFLAVTQDRVSA